MKKLVMLAIFAAVAGGAVATETTSGKEVVAAMGSGDRYSQPGCDAEFGCPGDYDRAVEAQRQMNEKAVEAHKGKKKQK